MKGLRKLFGKKAEKKNTVLLSAVRMQALGVLQICLDHAIGKPCILTQVSLAVTPPEPDAAGFHCDAMVKAFFYWSGKRKAYGQAGCAPMPPQVVASIRLRANGDRILKWDTPALHDVAITNANGSRWAFGGPWTYDSHDLRDVEIEAKIKDFTDEFNNHRPWGFAIMSESHDQVIWQINPSAHIEHFAN